MKPIKQMLCWMLAVLCLAGCFSGCQKEEAIVTEAVPTQSSGAMGRYVEQSIPLPECQYAEDLVMLDDGRLRVALRRTDGSVMVCTSGADRTTWADTWEVPGAISSTGDVAQIALSPDGKMFCYTMQAGETEGEYAFHLWAVEEKRRLSGNSHYRSGCGLYHRLSDSVL